MKTWHIVLIAVVATAVLTSLGGFLILKYGESNKDVGKANCEATQAKTQVVETVKAVKAKERVDNETKSMSDDDIDRDLVRLGIMRDDEDR